MTTELRTVMLAQARPRDLTPAEQSQLLLWGAVLIVVILIGGAVLMMVRKRMMRPPSEEPAGFTLHDLRTMRDQGEITADEYETARAKLIAKVKGTGSGEEK